MKTLKLFRNGDSQAVRLTKEFRFEGNEVIARKVGNVVVLSPKKIKYEDALAAVDRFKGVIRRRQPKLQTRDLF